MARFLNRVLIVSSFACFLVLYFSLSADAIAKPNIVIILADDMGFGDVHALNPDSKIATPNLDQLASQGMTFLDGHSPSAVCTPTRYGLLTGRYCWRTRLKSGVLGGYSKPLIQSSRITIAEMLKSQGYQTGAVGKWHLGMTMPFKNDEIETNKMGGDPGIDFGGVITNSPIHHGFDYYFGVSASLDMAPYVYVRNDRFTMLPTLQQKAVGFPHFVRKGPRSEDFVIDRVLDKLVEEASSFIRKSAAADDPYFLYVPLTAPHKPAQPHARFKGKTGLGEYGDFVAQVDASVGQIIAAIDETGEANETIVFYASDNGSYMRRFQKSKQDQDHVTQERAQGYFANNHRANGAFRGTKADIWEAGHHIPMFARWPQSIEAGSNCKSPVCLTDLFATCADLAGATLDDNTAEDSFSIVPMLQGKDVKRGAPVVHHSVAGMFAIRDGKWKLVLGNGSGGREAPRGKPFTRPYQLFDLSSDIAETQNVAADHRAVVDRLTDRLDQIRMNGRSR